MMESNHRLISLKLYTILIAKAKRRSQEIICKKGLIKNERKI